MQAQSDTLPDPRQLRPLQSDELTVLTSWAEAIAEVLACAPERAHTVLADALPGAPWRAALGIAEPSPPLSRAIDSMQTPVRSAIAATDEPTLSAVLLAAVARGPGEHELDALARRVLQSALEQRQVRLKRIGRHRDPRAYPASA